MEPIRDLAIVIRTIPYEERHRIVTAITENHGIISALGRNAIQSRRFGGTLETFAASEWLFALRPGSELAQLREAKIRRSYEGLKNDLDRLAMASAFNEFLLKTAPKYEPCSELFRLHANALAALDEQAALDFRLLNAYLAKLLHWSGNQPQLLACLSCKAEIDDFLNQKQYLSCAVAAGGWICPNCREQKTVHIEESGFQGALLRISPQTIFDFQLSLSLPIRQVQEHCRATPEEHAELFQFLEALFIYHVPGFDQKPIKSLQFLSWTCDKIN